MSSLHCLAFRILITISTKRKQFLNISEILDIGMKYFVSLEDVAIQTNFYNKTPSSSSKALID